MNSKHSIVHFGLCTISQKEKDPIEVIKLASRAGYDGVEIWGKGHLPSGDPDKCTQLRSTAQDAGLEIPVYGSYLRPGTADFSKEWMHHELTVCQGLGADLLRVWAGDVEFGDHTASQWRNVREDLQTITDAAADHDLAVTVEKHGGTLTNTKDGVKRLLTSIDGPCGLNWQPLFNLSAPELVDEVYELRHLINNVHFQAVPERGIQQRCALAQSYFDIPRCIDIITDSGFDGYLEVEFVSSEQPYYEAIEEDLHYLRYHC
jgi:sugar phosphate isomerase/epimerase